MLGGFVDGLTGGGVWALWDGGHCSCKLGVENVMQKAHCCGGIISVWVLERLKVSFVEFSQTTRTGLHKNQPHQRW